MKSKRQYTAIFIGVVLLVTFAVSVRSVRKIRSETAAGTTAFAEPAAEVPYLDAVQKLLTSEAYQMEISSIRETKMGSQVLSETSTRTVTCKNYGTDDMQLHITESAQSGPHSYHVTERYTDGYAYLTLEDSHFSAPISEKDYLKRLPPVALFDPALYNSVESQQQGGITQIGFSDASAPENWASHVDAEIQSASGTVLIDSQGDLVQSSYSLTYKLGEASVTRIVNVRYVPSQTDVFTPIVLSGPYTEIASIDIPRLLEKSTGYLLQASEITSAIDESVTFQAGNLSRHQHTDLDISGLGEELNATVGINVELVDYSQAGTSTKYSQQEKFRDDAYSLTVTEGTPPAQPELEITYEIMEKYCHNLLVGSVLLPQYISSVTIQEQDDVFAITFGTTEDFAQVMCADACTVLYQDPNMLDSISSTYRTDKIEASLLIDQVTMLPAASGITYSGSHAIDNTTYTLSYDIHQTYTFAQ